jgi:hypothetical protein
MIINIHPHAAQRAKERGAEVDEITITIEQGEQFPAKFERNGFRKNFSFDTIWNKKHYSTKQIEAYCVAQPEGWLVITVMVKYF